MSTTLKIALVIMLLVYWFLIIRAVRKKSMRINYLIFWLIMGVGMIIAIAIPNFVETVSKWIGFELPINMIFSGAILVVLYLVYDISKQLTKEQNKNTMLIQEMSIMKKRIEELEKKEK